MSVIYSTKDKIKLNVDGLIITISPLRFKVKSDMQAAILKGESMEAALIAMKNAVKNIEGLTKPDGTEYKLAFDGDVLSDDCIDDLLNIQAGEKINVIAIELLNGIPPEFTDPITGDKIEGVSFVKVESKRKRKK